MKNLGIFYFSGTGNTKIVAKLVAENFKTNGWEVDIIRMEDVNKGKTELNMERYDLIGLGSQVIGYGIPGVVRKFSKRLPIAADGMKAFIFRTSGGVAPINYNVSNKLKRILTRKHYDVCYEQLFSIGSNWIMKFDDIIMKQLYQATKHKVEIMCDAINHGERHLYKTGFKLRVKMGVIAALAAKTFPLLGKDAVVKSTCNRCGLCIKECPAENITLKNEKIKFHSSCSACLRCVYSCPKKAINYRIFRFIAIPNGYNVKRSLAETCNPNEIPNGKVPPFFQDYVKGMN